MDKGAPVTYINFLGLIDRLKSEKDDDPTIGDFEKILEDAHKERKHLKYVYKYEENIISQFYSQGEGTCLPEVIDIRRLTVLYKTKFIDIVINAIDMDELFEPNDAGDKFAKYWEKNNKGDIVAEVLEQITSKLNYEAVKIWLHSVMAENAD